MMAKKFAKESPLAVTPFEATRAAFWQPGSHFPPCRAATKDQARRQTALGSTKIALNFALIRMSQRVHQIRAISNLRCAAHMCKNCKWLWMLSPNKDKTYSRTCRMGQ